MSGLTPLKISPLKAAWLLSWIGFALLFSFVPVSGPQFTLILVVLLVVWVYGMYREGVYVLSDLPILFLLTGTIGFGRSFSLVGISVGRFPVYVTEIVLGLALLLLFIKRKSIVKILSDWGGPVPRDLRYILAVYFGLGMLYLVIGVRGNGSAALRDIVFFLYLLFIFLFAGLIGKTRDGANISDNSKNSEEHRKMRCLMYLLLPGVFMILYTGLLKYFIYVPRSSAFWQFTRGIKMPNLTLYCGLLMIVAICFFAYYKKKMKILMGFLMYFSFLMIIMAEVRAAWAALLVAMVTLVIFLRKEALILLLLIVVMAGSLFIIDHYELTLKAGKIEALTEQVKSVRHQSQRSMAGANIKWRLGIWGQTWKEIVEHPVFGWGYGLQVDYLIWGKPLSWLRVIGANTGILPPHNHTVNILYKMGFFGLILFLYINVRVFFLGAFYLGKCRSDYSRRLLIVGLVGLMYWNGMAFFFDIMESPPTGIFLWLLLGLILGVVHYDKKNFYLDKSG